MVSRGVEGCQVGRVGRVGMGCRGVESVSRFGVEVSRPEGSGGRVRSQQLSDVNVVSPRKMGKERLPDCDSNISSFSFLFFSCVSAICAPVPCLVSSVVRREFGGENNFLSCATQRLKRY